MLANHIPLFVFLLKLLVFLDRQQRIKCDITAVTADTCAKNMARVITPDCAGREGIRITGLNGASFQVDDDSFTETKASFSIKFFTYFDPSERIYLSYGRMGLYQRPNTFFFSYPFKKQGDIYGDYVAIPLKFKDVGELGRCELASAAKSDPWIQLIGKKLNVAQKQKREAPSGDQVKDYPWMMIGLDYDRHMEIGHFNLYLNGKIVHSINSTDGQYANLDHRYLGEIIIKYAQISCIEFSTEVQDESYFTDPALRECMKEYEGQPEQKFVECDANL